MAQVAYAVPDPTLGTLELAYVTFSPKRMLIVTLELLCELVFLLPLTFHFLVTPSIIVQMTIVCVRIGQWVTAVGGSRT
eukprot:236160-Amphidinium_carterae.1